MKIISVILYFLSHHPGWSFPILLVLFLLLWFWRGKAVYGILALLLPIANIFLSHMLNAWFLNAYGVRGTAIITQSEQTNSTLNDAYIYDYDVLVKTADGQDVITGFSTMSAAIYPVRNSILIPNDNEPFVVKYIPGFEKNIVILSDESDYGLARMSQERRQPIEKARRLYEASPRNETFKQGYLQALKTFVADSNNASETDLVEHYKSIIKQLEEQR